MTTIPQDNDGTETSKEYTFELEGNTLTAKREDPYGMFRLKLNKGKLPDKYQGLYTSTFEIEKTLSALQTELNVKKEK